MVVKDSTKKKWGRIARDFEETRDIEFVMEKHNCSRRLVRLACKETGVRIEGSVGRPVGSVKTDTWRIAAELMKGNRKYADIGEEFGLGISRIKSIKASMKEAGFNEALEFVRKKDGNLDELGVITSYLRGNSENQIAEEFKVSTYRIEQVIDRAKGVGLFRACRTYIKNKDKKK